MYIVPAIIAIQLNQTNTTEGQTPDSYSIQYTGLNDTNLIHRKQKKREKKKGIREKKKEA